MEMPEMIDFVRAYGVLRRSGFGRNQALDLLVAFKEEEVPRDMFLNIINKLKQLHGDVYRRLRRQVTLLRCPRKPSLN